MIRAFNEMPSQRLLVVGDGQQSSSLRASADPNVKFIGFLPREDYVKVIARARAFVFAGYEDFGIALAEAQASGTPLVAFGRGATDIVRPLGQAERATGILFNKQSVEAVVNAVKHLDEKRTLVLPAAYHQNAMRLSPERLARARSQRLSRWLRRYTRGRTKLPIEPRKAIER